jgi:hypothetical protein
MKEKLLVVPSYKVLDLNFSFAFLPSHSIVTVRQAIEDRKHFEIRSLISPPLLTSILYVILLLFC